MGDTSHPQRGVCPLRLADLGDGLWVVYNSEVQSTLPAGQIGYLSDVTGRLFEDIASRFSQGEFASHQLSSLQDFLASVYSQKPQLETRAVQILQEDANPESKIASFIVQALQKSSEQQQSSLISSTFLNCVWELLTSMQNADIEGALWGCLDAFMEYGFFYPESQPVVIPRLTPISMFLALFDCDNSSHKEDLRRILKKEKFFGSENLTKLVEYFNNRQRNRQSTTILDRFIEKLGRMRQNDIKKALYLYYDFQRFKRRLSSEEVGINSCVHEGFSSMKDIPQIDQDLLLDVTPKEVRIHHDWLRVKARIVNNFSLTKQHQNIWRRSALEELYCDALNMLGEMNIIRQLSVDEAYRCYRLLGVLGEAQALHMQVGLSCYLGDFQECKNVIGQCEEKEEEEEDSESLVLFDVSCDLRLRGDNVESCFSRVVESSSGKATESTSAFEVYMLAKCSKNASERRLFTLLCAYQVVTRTSRGKFEIFDNLLLAKLLFRGEVSIKGEVSLIAAYTLVKSLLRFARPEFLRDYLCMLFVKKHARSMKAMLGKDHIEATKARLRVIHGKKVQKLSAAAASAASSPRLCETTTTHQSTNTLTTNTKTKVSAASSSSSIPSTQAAKKPIAIFSEQFYSTITASLCRESLAEQILTEVDAFIEKTQLPHVSETQRSHYNQVISFAHRTLFPGAFSSDHPKKVFENISLTNNDLLRTFCAWRKSAGVENLKQLVQRKNENLLNLASFKYANIDEKITQIYLKKLKRTHTHSSSSNNNNTEQDDIYSKNQVIDALKDNCDHPIDEQQQQQPAQKSLLSEWFSLDLNEQDNLKLSGRLFSSTAAAAGACLPLPLFTSSDLTFSSKTTGNFRFNLTQQFQLVPISHSSEVLLHSEKFRELLLLCGSHAVCLKHYGLFCEESQWFVVAEQSQETFVKGQSDDFSFSEVYQLFQIAQMLAVSEIAGVLAFYGTSILSRKEGKIYLPNIVSLIDLIVVGMRCDNNISTTILAPEFFKERCRGDDHTLVAATSDVWAIGALIFHSLFEENFVEEEEDLLKCRQKKYVENRIDKVRNKYLQRQEEKGEMVSTTTSIPPDILEIYCQILKRSLVFNSWQRSSASEISRLILQQLSICDARIDESTVEQFFAYLDSEAITPPIATEAPPCEGGGEQRQEETIYLTGGGGFIWVNYEEQLIVYRRPKSGSIEDSWTGSSVVFILTNSKMKRQPMKLGELLEGRGYMVCSSQDVYFGEFEANCHPKNLRSVLYPSVVLSFERKGIVPSQKTVQLYLDTFLQNQIELGEEQHHVMKQAKKPSKGVASQALQSETVASLCNILCDDYVKNAVESFFSSWRSAAASSKNVDLFGSKRYEQSLKEDVVNIIECGNGRTIGVVPTGIKEEVSVVVFDHLQLSFHVYCHVNRQSTKIAHILAAITTDSCSLHKASFLSPRLYFIGDLAEGQFSNGQLYFGVGLTLEVSHQPEMISRDSLYETRINYNKKYIYEGTLNNAMYHGQGVYSNRKQVLYEGMFFENTLVEGVIYFDHQQHPTIEKYEGEVLFDKETGSYLMHGEGKCFMKDKSVFEGQFERNNFNGRGKLILQKKRGVYEGSFKDGLRDGVGVLTSKNSTFEGEFKGGLKTNFGKEVTRNGKEIYEGEYQNNKRHGVGILIAYYDEKQLKKQQNTLKEEGQVNYYYSGSFVDDKKQGQGVEVFDGARRFAVKYYKDECLRRVEIAFRKEDKIKFEEQVLRKQTKVQQKQQCGKQTSEPIKLPDISKQNSFDKQQQVQQQQQYQQQEHEQQTFYEIF